MTDETRTHGEHSAVNDEPASVSCKSGESAGDLALSKAVRITAYDRKDPLAIRLEFADDADRVSAADEIDEILSDAFAAARSRMAASLDETRERRGGRLIPVRCVSTPSEQFAKSSPDAEAVGRRERIKAVSERLLTRMREYARQDGWALAVHGSMCRDLDVVAVPWTDEASDSAAFVEAMRAAMAMELGGTAIIGAGEDGRTPGFKAKPNGRRCYTLHSTSEQLVEDEMGAHPYVDLSVMDLRSSPDAAGSGGEAFPDIGTDPMQGDRVDRIEQSVAACRAAYVTQQKGVPDQTALVWRWHLGALLECATRLNAILSRTDATQTREAEGTDKFLSWRGGVEGYDQSLEVATKEIGDEAKARSVLWLIGLDHVWKHVEALRAALNGRGGASE